MWTVAWERRLENINALHEVREIGFHAEFVCGNVVSLAVALSLATHTFYYCPELL